jgi:hypothetical protein
LLLLAPADGSLLNPTPFKSDAELIKQRTDVRALDASTIDGQATVGFAGVVTARRLAESALSKKQVARLRRKHIKLKATFEAFIAANGVPVRMNIVLSIGKVRLIAGEDVLAIDFPVTVPPPLPAAETIGATELEKIEAARLKKVLKKFEEAPQVGLLPWPRARPPRASAGERAQRLAGFLLGRQRRGDRLRAVVCAELRVDALGVLVHGARADRHLGRDRLRRAPAREQTQHL